MWVFLTIPAQRESNIYKISFLLQGHAGLEETSVFSDDWMVGSEAFEVYGLTPLSMIVGWSGCYRSVII
jgi:hypothetical protein